MFNCWVSIKFGWGRGFECFYVLLLISKCCDICKFGHSCVLGLGG